MRAPRASWAVLCLFQPWPITALFRCVTRLFPSYCGLSLRFGFVLQNTFIAKLFMTNTHSTNRFIQYSATCTLTLASSFAASAAQPFASSIAPTSNSIAQTIFKSSMAATASQQSAGAFQARAFTGTNSNNAQTLQVTDTDGSGTIDGGDWD